MKHRVGRRVCAALVSLSMLLPGSGANAMMTTPGAFRVTENGAASYEIPLRIAPGTSGMAPKLSLAYSSQTGNGLIGVGWSLSGLSAITRCPRTVAQDNVRGGVLFNANDRFCLDGQRLIAIAGTYGADGTEYRTERDGFAKIVSWGAAGTGPAWFEVQTKSGQTLELGNSADSRAEAQGRSEARVWGLNKIMDTMGNYLTVTYTDDQTNGDHYPTRIDYTGNAWSVPVLSPSHSVRFVYEARTDNAALYQAGSLVRNMVRLKNVQTYAGASMVTDYRIAYATSPHTSRSRLTSITECPPAGACLPATTVSWSVPGTSFGTDTMWGTRVGDFTANGGGSKLYDMNSDGLADLVYDSDMGVRVMLNSGGSSFGTSTQWGTRSDGIQATSFGLRYADMNRDGKMDMVYDSISGVRVMLNNGSSFNADSVWGTRVGNYTINDGGRLMMIDVNADDWPDAVYDSTTGIRVLLGTGTALGTDTVRGTRTTTVNPNGGVVMLADMNGDGAPDIVYDSDANGIRVLLNNGAGTFGTDTQWGVRTYSFNGNAKGIQLADVNGDGLPDVVYDSPDNGVRVLLNKGTSLVADTLWGTRAVSYSASSPGLRMVDVNADGRADLVYDGADGVRVMLSTGAAFAADAIWGTRTDNVSLGDATRVKAEDVGGDGRGDIVYDGATGIRVLKTSGVTADVIASVVDGIGATTTITYKPLTDSTVYTIDTGAVYPTRELRVPMYVVSSFTASNGIGGTFQFIYNYTGLKANVQGRGLLGFRVVQVTDPLGLKGFTTNRQDWPFIGLPSQMKRTTAGGAVITQVDNTYLCKDLDADPDICTIAVGKRYFPYVSVSVELNNDLNAAFMTKVHTTNTFDSFGNPTLIVVRHRNQNDTETGYVKTTTNQYTNTTTGGDWLLGRLTLTTVKSDMP